MKLSEILTPDVIVAPLKSSNKKHAINELLDVLHEKELVKSREDALKDILTREKHLSTGMENGLAVPHAKSDSVDKLIIAFGFHREGIEFESLDGKPAHFIFLVMSPRDTSGPHIQALASISRFLKNDDVRQRLLEAPNKDDIYDILCEG
ncbi:MAG: PTS sugar transporter subunit IIA [Calditrichaeota bacterium]|nr:MAG: PTS sugar transporter subunit IIA [Calditrichota bacterium]MBL1206297.1 PTS sugar transporter subunit IIA [Calditrichota bacterium]NOG46123.1 PTS sugar transporter subunit IIA [Calditrichota bacterium]